MGWSFRKSINLGPIRLNLSKSGVGFSTGVRGFRVSTGPRGTRLNAGVGPLRYTKTLSGHSPHTHVTPTDDAPPIPPGRPAGLLTKLLAAIGLIVVLAVVGLVLLLVVVAVLRTR